MSKYLGQAKCKKTLFGILINSSFNVVAKLGQFTCLTIFQECKDLQRSFSWNKAIHWQTQREEKHTVWKPRKKFNDFLPIGSSGGKGLSVSKWRVWHTAAARARGEIEEIESISRPGLLLILKCRLWWWKWLTVTLPPAFPLLPPSGKTESPTSHNKQSNPSFWGHQLWI